jgi:hypothetical protein
METRWYAAADQRRSVREIVVEVNRPRSVGSKFGVLMLGETYRSVMASLWAVSLVRLERDPGPYLLLRADGHTTRLRDQPFRVAFCFYKMAAGGLFALYVDFPTLEIPKAPSAPYVLFETIRGIDLDDARERIHDAINRPQLRLCFAEGEGPGEDLGSGLWASHAIDALYDVVIDLGDRCREALNREWRSLLDYHDSVSGGRRDFHASVRQMQSENPLTHNPIIDRAGAAEA